MRRRPTEQARSNITLEGVYEEEVAQQLSRSVSDT
jgi:hypothetical protein